MKELQIPFGDKNINAIWSTAEEEIATLILAHGAGAPMRHPFMNMLSEKLNGLNVSTLRFNFPYIDAGRKSPGSPKPNVAAWAAVLSYAMNKSTVPVFMSGKSYGGRMGSHLLAEESPGDKVSGILYFGFPLHAPGRDSKDRAAHLDQIPAPQLFVQGTRDALANYQLIGEVVDALPQADLCTIEGADHSFKVSGTKPYQILDQIARETKNWISRKIP